MYIVPEWVMITIVSGTGCFLCVGVTEKADELDLTKALGYLYHNV